MVTVAAATTLILNDVTVTGSEITDTNATTSIIQVDNTHTLTINGTTIHGGTINDGTVANTGGASGGTIHVTGNSAIDGAEVQNGVIDVDGNVTLTLENVAFTGTTIVAGAATIVANGSTGVLVDASALADGDTLTLLGDSAFTVVNLVGILDASGLTGTLSVTTADAVDNAITITTGSNTTTIDSVTFASDTVTVHAAQLLDNKLLTLSGASNFVVDGLQGNLDANNTTAPLTKLTGTLSVTTADAVDNAITITTGSNTTTIDSVTFASDTVTVHAAQLLDNKLLTLSGASNFVVDGLQGNLDANNTTAPLTKLTGTLSVTTADAVDNAITITTGSNTTTIDSVTFASDTVTVHAAQLLDNKLLTLSGASNFVVDGLQGNLDANNTTAPLTKLTGTLSVTTADAVDNAITITTGSNTTTIDSVTFASDTVTVHAAQRSTTSC